MRPTVFLLLFLFGFLSYAQHQDKVDFPHGEIMIRISPQSKEINGHVTYKLNTIESIDSVFLDAKNMKFESVEVDGKKVKYLNSGKIITLFKRFKKGKSYELFLSYSVQPKQTVYFFDSNVIPSGVEGLGNTNDQIWTQGQGKYTSHWLPSFDDMEEKVEFDLSIIIDEGFKVISNGKLIHNSRSLDNTRMWSFNMNKPMSSYLLAFAIGNYKKQELQSKSGIPIQNYYYPQDSLRVESTYRYTKEIFDFLEKEIGFPYPWQNYKQMPVRDFLYAGMENTTATIFADGYVIDSTAFVDKNYVNVNAHEMAHQWFGNLVTEKDGNHHWLHEGFATYYAQLAEKEIFGADHYYWKLYKSLEQLNDAVSRGEGQRLTDPKASSLTFYEKGAWALFMLRHKIGDVFFREGIKSYLKKYQFKNVTITDFLKEMEIASGQDLSDFRRDWLENKGIPIEDAKMQLRTASKSLDIIFSIEENVQKASGSTIDYLTYWEKSNSIHLKKHILDTYHRELDEKLWQAAFASDTIPIRQLIAKKMDTIPSSLKTKFESLLADKSYITIENALFKLWMSYPEEKIKYLEKTKNVVGLPNKNVRLLWLTLAILTNDYNSRNTNTYFKELGSYTGIEYGWEIRMGAFQYLNQALGLDTESLRNLVNATNHHSWQFKKFARNLVDELMTDEDYKVRFEVLAQELDTEETHYLKTKLN